MKVLESILDDSREYYKNIQREIIKRLSKLPKGSIKKRKIRDRYYYYLQERIGEKIVHKYLGRSEPKDLIEKIRRRKMLKKELREIRLALKLLSKAKGKHD